MMILYNYFAFSALFALFTLSAVPLSLSGVSFSPAGLLTPYHLGASYELSRMGLMTSSTAVTGASGGALAAVTRSARTLPMSTSLLFTLTSARGCQPHSHSLYTTLPYPFIFTRINSYSFIFTLHHQCCWMSTSLIFLSFTHTTLPYPHSAAINLTHIHSYLLIFTLHHQRSQH